MIDELRPRRGAVLTLALMLALAAGSFWLLKKMEQSEPGAAQPAQRGLPDYTMHQFRYTAARDGSSADYLVEGERLSHYPDRNETVVEDFRMTRYSADRPNMIVSSDTASTNVDRSEFHLYDHVVLRRPVDGPGDELIVTSDYMLILPNQEIAKTHRPVQAQQGSTTLKGIGMTANSKQQTLALHSAVNAIYLPPERMRR